MGTFFFTAVIYPLTQIIEFVFSFCYKVFEDFGLSIIGVSLAVSMLTLPLYIVAEHWQEKERELEKKLAPGVKRIKAVFKGNEQYMILSTFYRQKHYHPIMALRSSFGLLIQIPFFTAAYSCLSDMQALNGQGWTFIKDLGAEDALFNIGSFPINILPIVMTVVNCISGTIYTRGLKLREKLQVFGLALVFVAILYHSPAGLVLYWTCNNLFSLVKNIFYKLSHPLKTFWIILCTFVTVFIVWLFAGIVLSTKRSILVSAVFSLIYLAPLFIRFFKFLIKSPCCSFKDNWKKRLALFSSSSIGLFSLIALLIPTLLISSSPMEFSGIDNYTTPLFFVRNCALQAFGLCVVWPFLIYFLYGKEIQALLAILYSVIFSSAILNTFLFHGSYGIMSNLLKFRTVANVDSSIASIFINLIALFVLALLIFFLLYRQKGSWICYGLSFTAAAMISVSFVNISKINSGYARYVELSKTNNADIKEIKPIFHLSKTGKNVLVIYLDKAQNRYVAPIMDEYPALYDDFSGFTLYRNTLSFNGYTLLGAAPCYGGYEYTPEGKNERPDVSLQDKQNEAILLLPRIFTEQAEDFSAVITDPSWANLSWIPDLEIFKDYPEIQAHSTDSVYLDQWYKEHKDVFKSGTTSRTLKRNMLWYSVFRSVPLFFRTAIYNDGYYWDPDSNDEDMNAFLEGYSVLDYLKRLTDFNPSSENSFIYFVNNTTHDQSFLQYPDYIPVSPVTNPSPSLYSSDGEYQSNAAALHRLGEYFRWMKDNGVYDNTRIIIVADHSSEPYEQGYEWDEKFEKIGPGHFHPLLMMKDFASEGRLKYDDGFMTNADVPDLALHGIVENPVNPFTSKRVDSSAKEKGALVCTKHIFMPYQNKDKYIYIAPDENWWRVKDNIFKSSNWVNEAQDGGK